MRKINLILLLFLAFIISLELNGQIDDASSVTPPLFDNDAILAFELVGDLKVLFRDRSGPADDFPFILVERDGTNDEIRHQIKAKTRGHFRRIKGNCTYPPLWLDFSKNQIPSRSIFNKQNKLKLVMPCQGEKYVVREYLVYKLYNQLTPRSFNARLVKISFIDEQREKVQMTVFGILLEDEDQMATRNQANVIHRDLIRPKQIDEDNFNQVAVFQFLIGNTDWSVQYRQNIKILEDKVASNLFVTPYDFDHAGMVKAPYARPAQELELTSVAQRRYRGYCVMDLKKFKKTIDIYKKKKPDLYKVIQKNAEMLDKGSVKYCTKYLDEFFKVIENDRLWQKAFSYPCRKDGTGNVVIRGLRKE